MLLKQTTRPPRSRRIMTMLRDDEQGAALAAVLGLMATLLLLSTLVVGSVYQSTGFTAMSRASIQSQASAEAGIAAARTVLIAGECAAKGPEITNSDFGATSPLFSATIMVPDISDPSGWSAGCPASSTVPVRILSTGTAESGGVGGISAGDHTTLEAMLDTVGAPGTIVAGGAAVYGYQAGTVSGSASVQAVNGSQPSVVYKTGDATCMGGWNAVTTVIVENGDFDNPYGDCHLAGDVWASGWVRFTGDTQVQGNVVANGVTLTGSAGIHGNVWSTGLVDGSGANTHIYGVLKTTSLNTRGLHLHSSAYVYGSTIFNTSGGPSIVPSLTTQTHSGGIPSGWPVIVQNPITSPTFASDLPATPIVPDWIDFGAQPEDYTSEGWAGFTIHTITSTSQCNNSNFRSLITSFGTNPGVIDARICTGGFSITGGGETFTLGNDLAIIANHINFQGGAYNFTGAAGFTSTDPVNVWFIKPDTVDDNLPYGLSGTPSCGSQTVKIDWTTTFATNVAGLIYSPCDVTMSQTFRGQIYAKKVTLDGTGKIFFTPVGLPGYDMDSGEELSPGGGEIDRVVSSVRNVSG